MLIHRLLIAITTAAVLALSTLSAQAEPMRIAYLSPSFDVSDAWERVYWALQGRLDELKVDYDIQALAVASHVDHAGQLAQVESVIARGVDYVFLGPTEYEAAIPALRKLKQAGIPTVVYNFLEPHQDEAARAMSYIAFSHTEGGRLSGEWAAKHLDGKGKIAILQGAPGVVSDQRKDGFLNVIKQHPDIEVVLGPHTDFDRSKAFDAAQNLLTAHDDLNLIYGVSTAVGLGAGQAIRQAGKSEQIASMGFGGTGDGNRCYARRLANCIGATFDRRQWSRGCRRLRRTQQRRSGRANLGRTVRDDRQRLGCSGAG